MNAERMLAMKGGPSHSERAAAAQPAPGHETIVYFEIKFHKTVDVLEKPHVIELTLVGPAGPVRLELPFMACRMDEQRKDCFLTYVSQGVLPKGTLIASTGRYIDFEIHQRSKSALYTREEFFHTSRRPRENQTNVLIRRKYRCRVHQELSVVPNMLELYISATAEAYPDSMQQAISIPDKDD